MSDDIHNDIARYIEELTQRPFRVLVFGPGEEHATFWKREEIVEALRRQTGFEVFIPEELSGVFPSELFLDQQEEILGRHSDLVIVLDSSEGPLTELARFSFDRRFLRKAFVFYPRRYLRNVSETRTFPGDVLAKFQHQSYPYTEDEFERCDLVGRVIAVARSYRNAWGGDFPSTRF